MRRAAASAGSRAIFGLHARHAGNAVGYDTIAASGEHACTLHWIRNDGDVREGDLLLLDAGVELDSLYTADVTRTLPVNGRFTDSPAKGLRRRASTHSRPESTPHARGEVLRRARGGRSR